MTPWRRILIGLKLAVGAGLLVFLIRQIELGAIIGTIGNSDGNLLLTALAISALASVFEVAKFRAACHYRIEYRDSAVLVFIGLFLSNFLPSNIGGDGYKLWALRRRSVSGSAAFAYIVSDRVTGLIALVLLGGAGYFLARSSGSGDVLGAIQLVPRISARTSAALAIAGVVLVLILASQQRLRRRIRKSAARLTVAGKAYLSVPALPTLGHSLLMHACRALALSMTCAATGFAVPMTAVLQILFLVALVSTVPISIGGLGVREGTLVFLLQRCGIPAEAAVAAALINLGILWLKSLVGAVLFIGLHARGKSLPIDGPGAELL